MQVSCLTMLNLAVKEMGRDTLRKAIFKNSVIFPSPPLRSLKQVKHEYVVNKATTNGCRYLYIAV